MLREKLAFFLHKYTLSENEYTFTFSPLHYSITFQPDEKPII